MPYTFDPIFAVDPGNPANVAANAVVTIFAPGDTSLTPLVLSTPDGLPFENPVTTSSSGHAGAFVHESLGRVAWSGGGFTGFFTAHDSIKQDAIAARDAAQLAAENAAAELSNRIEAGEFQGEPGRDGSNVVPTAQAIATEISTEGTPANTALNATYVSAVVVAPGDDLQAKITEALTKNLRPGVFEGETYAPVRVRLLPGIHTVASGFTVNLAVTSSALRDRRRLHIEGDSEGGTTLKFDHTAGAGIQVLGGKLTWENMRLVGNGSNKLVSLGDTSTTISFVNQFQFRNVEFFSAGTFVETPWAFDGALYDCGFFSSTVAGWDVPNNGIDNNNNIHFYRCHWETGAAGTFFRMRGSNATPAQIHNVFGFHGCHFETRYYTTRIIDAEWVGRLEFHGCQFTQNNSHGGGPGVGTENAVPLFRFIDVTDVLISSSVVGRDAVSTTWGAKFFELGGRTRGIVAAASFFNPATNPATFSKSALWQSSTITAYSGGDTPILLQGSRIGDAYNASVPNEASAWADPASTAMWSARYDAGSLRFGYGSRGADWSTGRTDRLSLGKDGALSLGYLAASQWVVPDATVQALSHNADNNPNRRGLYMVTANTSAAGAVALVFSNGGALTPVFVGDLFSVGNTDPGTAGKVSLYLSGVTLTANNRSGAAKTLAVLPFGFV